MQESKDPKATETKAAGATPKRGKPDSDATSSKTLGDLEKTEKVSNGEGAAAGEGSAVPSPDGAFDDSRGGGNSDAGPM